MRSVCVLVLASGLAFADEPSPDEYYPRLSAGVGIGLRSGDLAVLRANGASFSGQLEVKLRPSLFVAAQYDYSQGRAVDDDMRAQDFSITAKTFGISLRSLLMSFGEKPHELGGDMFVTGGIAREWIDWQTGDLARTALVLGAGTTMHLPSRETHRHLRFGFRFAIARAPDPAKGVPGCTGPCDTPTTTQPYDLSFVAELTCHIGR